MGFHKSSPPSRAVLFLISFFLSSLLALLALCRRLERLFARAMEEPWSFTVDAKRSQKRARFNLLGLEHDEYYFQVCTYIWEPSGMIRVLHKGPERSVKVLRVYTHPTGEGAADSTLADGFDVV